MRRLPIAIAFVLSLLVAGAAAAEVRIVTTTTDLAAIARALGGRHVAAESLTRGASDPHFAEARPGMIRALFRADLLLVVGAELEVGWLPAALQASRNAKVLRGGPGYLDLSHAARLIEVPTGPINRAMGDVHAKGNPHYLLDPRNGMRAAAAIAELLQRTDPAHAAVYAANLADFRVLLDSRMQDWRASLAPLGGKPVIDYHKTFSYLADAFGFRIVDHVEPLPGIPPTAAHLASLTERIGRESIPLLIMAPFYERRSADLLHRRTGIRIAVLPQAVGAEEGIDSYPALFDAIVARLAAAGAK
jgi:zinc/manganese transport system substrate-binding protein